MHEMGCARQNFKCPTCQMCVPKADKAKHEEEMHVPATCEHCGFQAPKFQFGNHLDNCKSKPQQCKFCDQVVPVPSLNEHLQVCGSKTFKCEDCGEFVKKMEKEIHKFEGFCDVYKESKREKMQRETDKEMEKFQQQRLKEIEEMKNNPPPRQPARQAVPKTVIQPKADTIMGSSQPAGELTEEDQRIFSQYMGDEDDEALARKLQEEYYGGAGQSDSVAAGSMG